MVILFAFLGANAVTLVGHDVANCTTLSPGVSQSQFTASQSLSCFQFDLSSFQNEAVYVSVDPEYGDPDLYVATSEYSGTDSLWSELNWGADFLTIEAADSDRCSCQLIIGVYGVTDSMYEIRAWGESTTLALTNGLPQTLYLSPGVLMCTKIPVEGSHDFHISVTTLTSDFDTQVFVATGFCPNQTHHSYMLDDQGSLWIGSDSTVTADYFISIEAEYETWVEILAVEGSPVQLENAVPIQMEAPENEAIHFDLTLQRNLEMGEVDFVLTTLSGTVNLYLSLSGFPDPSTPSSYDFVNNEMASTKEIEIHTSEVDCHVNTDSQTCQYYITVHCVTACEFNLLARYGDSVTPLIEGESITLDVSDNAWTYFSFDVEGTNHDLIFEADSQNGEIEMFVGTSVNYVNSSNADYSDSGNFPNVHIPGASGSYFISIHCPTGTTFTLSATILSDDLTNAKLLLDGESSWINVASWGWTHRYFKFNVDSNVAYVEFSIENYIMNTDLYITNDHQSPSADHNQWHYDSGSQPLIRIDNPESGMYYLRVDCPSVCYYSLTASFESAIHALTSGYPMTETLELQEWAYYTFESQSTEVDISIDVSALNGDPDLYVSTLGLPTLDTYVWNNRAYGSDALFISHDDSSACGICTYTIGVYAYSATTYTITAGAEGVTQLVDGTPQVSSVNHQSMRLFRVTLEPTNHELTFTLTDIAGNTELYVRAGETPSLEHYDYVSATSSSGESIVIPTVDCTSQVCDYYVGVYGLDDTSEFSLLASSQHTHATLLDSVPLQTSAIGGEFSFFTYYLSQPCDLIIALTVTTGNPDLFISRTVTAPSIHEHDYMVTPPNALTIAKNDTVAGEYHFSVFSPTDTTFSLSVISTGKKSGTQLVTGRSEFGQASALDMSYFITSITDGGHISISLQSGEADVYINPDSPPSLSEYSAFSHTSNSGGWISIAPFAGKTYIGIKATTRTASFWITAIDKNSPIQLSQGVPLVAEIAEASDPAMQFILQSESASQDLNLQITSFEGYLDMRAAPTDEDGIHFSATTVTGGYILQIPMTELLHHDEWKIEVNALAAPARFVILPDCSDVTFLQDGVPQQSQMESLPVHFRLQVRSDYNEFVVTVTPLSQCSGAKFFLSNVGESDETHGAQYSGEIGSSVIVHQSDHNSCTDCTYYVTVVSEGYCAFSAIFTSEGRVSQLQNGVPQSGTVEAGTYTYYSIVSAADVVSGVEISIVTDDKAMIFVNTENINPTLESAVWSGEKMVVISDSDPNFDPLANSYHIGVLGKNTDSPSTFTIMALIQTPGGVEVTTLLYNHLQAEVLIHENAIVHKSYVYTMPPGETKFQMQVEVLDGKIIALECGDDALLQSFAGREVISFEKKDCDQCTLDFLVIAEPKTIYSLLIGEFEVNPAIIESKSRKGMWIALVVLLIVLICAFFYAIRKNRRLNYELDATESELNQQGKFSRRQREANNEARSDGNRSLYDYAPANNVQDDLRQYDDGTNQLL